MASSPVQSLLMLFVSTFGGEVDSYVRRAYERALDGIPADVILEAADKLIDEAAGGRKFYPMPTAPDVKGACAAVMTRKRQQAFAEAVKHCDHPRQFEAIVDGEGVTRYTRCSCWKRGQLAMEAAGQALALPAHQDSEVA